MNKLNKYIELEPDAEEKELLGQIEKNEFVRVKDFEKEKEDAKLASENFMSKKRNIGGLKNEKD